jgi:HD-GYP domain-containing protein (c-di-GMP phosphodiesterase class II)
LGLPFASGHYLALRCIPSASFAPGCRSVWHRDPAGVWTFYATTPGEQSCSRYFSSATASDAVQCDIDVAWVTPWSLYVQIPELLEWHLDIRASTSTRLMTRIAQRLPAAAWTNRLTLGVLGRAGGPVMGAGQIRLLGAVQASLAFAFERYDGGGLPAGAHGDEILVQVRVAQVADMVEVHHRVYGVDGAVAMARSRRGGQFDPRVVDVFIQHADAVLAGPPAGDAWAAALRGAPVRHQRLDEQGLDTLLVALGDFVDLTCPFTLGHSRAVARLAGDAALAAGVDADAAALVRRAGHVHDLGRIGVSNQIWSKPASLSGAEFERVRLHPYLTVRILNQVPGLARVAEVAGNHHECLNGSGYPRGLAGTALSLPDRVLAAAVSYQSACEPRPYRDELSPGVAARRLRERVRAGELEAVAAEAVLHAAGEPAQRPNLRPAGLTPRKIEVLCLVARGASNKQIAESLVISEKTARNHLERTYAKIGVSNRIGASMYALRNGLDIPGG